MRRDTDEEGRRGVGSARCGHSIRPSAYAARSSRGSAAGARSWASPQVSERAPFLHAYIFQYWNAGVQAARSRCLGRVRKRLLIAAILFLIST